MSEKGKEREGRHRDHLQINYGRPVAGLIGCDGERERGVQGESSTTSLICYFYN